VASHETRTESTLMDVATLGRELGVKRATAERVMRLCSTKVVLGRRVYVYRAHVEAVLRAHEVRDAA
jgi:hypothetical protein